MSIDAPPRIYVFDFDQTITHIHTGGRAVTPEEISEEYIHSNLKDGFVELIDGLARKNISVYIATYGDDRFGRDFDGATVGHALVKRYMDVAFGVDQTHFHFEQDNAGEIHGNIIARYSLDGKQYHLTRILAREGIDDSDPIAMHSILLLDDDAQNVHYFAQRGCATMVPSSPYESARQAADPGLMNALLDGLKPA